MESDRVFSAQKSAAARVRQQRTAEETAAALIAKTQRTKYLAELALAAKGKSLPPKGWFDGWHSPPAFLIYSQAKN